MKKIILLLITILILLPNGIYAAPEITFSVEELYSGFTVYPLIYNGSQPPDVVEINGVKYMWKSLRKGAHPVKYDPATYDFFMGLPYIYDCIFTGEYYMIRNCGADYTGAEYKMYGADIEFYDTELNLVHKASFERYIRNIGYYNGTYYCEEIENGIKTSTDMVNWTVQTGEKFFPKQIGDIVYNSVNPSLPYALPDDQISIKGSEFMKASYEGLKGFNIANFGEWNVGCSSNLVCFTGDNIYRLIIKRPDDIKPLAALPSPITVYEYGDDIIMEWSTHITYPKEGDVRKYRLRVPKQPVYDELERLKSAPYVSLNNTILAFEEPPVVEDGNMLVPMRFLFEQMGAEVAWDNDTQTAMVMQNNDNISFQINNATATVNDVPKTMNVPAKLVNDKTMVPIRFLSENLGYTVDRDGDANMALVNQ